MGRFWYEDEGKYLTKKNTFTDFCDATKELIDRGITKADRVATEGASAGGLLMGAVLNMHPELFKVRYTLRTLSYYTLSYYTLSYTLSYYTLSYYTLSYTPLIRSSHTLSHTTRSHTLSHTTLSHTTRSHTTRSHTLSHALSHTTLSHTRSSSWLFVPTHQPHVLTPPLYLVLFKVATCKVPFVDVAVTMRDASIPLTVVEWEEWGNPNEEKVG
jgi:hypothetical protein